MAANRFVLPSDGLLAAQVCLAQRLPAGHPVRLRAVARRTVAFAAELRRAAAILLSGADAGMWSGPAHGAFVDQLRTQAPMLGMAADRYEYYAAELGSYARVLDEARPRLAGARRQLQYRHDELAARPRPSAGSLLRVAGAPDPGAELLPVARQFKAGYDQWADALDRCNTALLRASETDRTHDPHGLRGLGHRIAGYLSPFEQAVLHPSLHNVSACLGSLNGALTVLGLGLIFICPPAGAACLVAATVLAAAQLAVDATRRAHGEHVSSASLGLELAAAIPIGGSAVRGLRAADNVVHLVPGGGLLVHEGLDGGHTLAKHVGKSEEFLRHRLATEPALEAASTFHDRQVAESTLSELLGANAHEISRWLSGTAKTLILVGRAPRPVGVVVMRNSAGSVPGLGIKSVLRRSAATTTGYRIHTAMVEL